MGVLSSVLGLFKGKDVLGETLGTIDSLVTTGEEKAVLRKDVVGAWVEAQSQAIVSEYQYGNVLSRSWRPILMLLWGGAITYHQWFAPAMGLPAGPDVPPEMWFLLQIGVGGYIGGRSLEKITAMIAPGRKLKKLLAALEKQVE